MMILNQNQEKELRLNKLSTQNIDFSSIELIISQYANHTRGLELTKIFISLIAGEEMLVIQKRDEVYQLINEWGTPSVKKCEAFEKFVKSLIKYGVPENQAFKCAISVFFVEGNVETVRKALNEKQNEEMERRNKIAMETPTWFPDGYEYVEGNMFTGIVISDQYGNEFTYIPYLEIYVSRYEISQDKYGWGRSVAGEKAWVNIKYKQAQKVALEFDPNANSDLLFSIGQIKEAIAKKTGINFHNWRYDGGVELRTGAMPENMIYNIDCLEGNHYCILKSKNPRNHVRVHGHAYNTKDKGMWYYSSERESSDLPNNSTGFRICLKRD